MNISTFQNNSNNNYAGLQELLAIESALTNYNANLVNYLSSFFKASDSILDFGAGIGTLATLWEAKMGNKPECLEIDPALRSAVLERGFVCSDSLDQLDRLFDGIYTSNVLEHIQDDVSTLRILHTKIAPGGYIAVYVPAFMCLYSSMDAAVGHYRRYSKRVLCDKLSQAGFKVHHSSYADSIGFFVWMILKFKGPKAKSSLSNIKALAKYDRYIYPLSNLIDQLGFKFLFGKNLLVVAQK